MKEVQRQIDKLPYIFEKELPHYSIKDLSMEMRLVDIQGMAELEKRVEPLVQKYLPNYFAKVSIILNRKS